MELIPALGRYAERFHRVAGTQHHVASPLGAWLLLALVAKAAPPGHDLAEDLGMDPDEAATLAGALLEQPHSMVGAASAVWYGPDADVSGPAGWWAGLPPTTSFGPLPGRPELDRWVREHSLGLIESMPDVSPQALLVLATVLATKVSWREPFTATPAADLGPDSPWASRLSQALRTPHSGHRMFIARSEHAGEIIVHVASGVPAEDPDDDYDQTGGLQVVSVAAAPGVDPARVLAAAYEIAPACVSGRRPRSQVSLAGLPLGETPLWTIRETEVHGDSERYSAVLPCWSAHSTLDLSVTGPGFPAAAKVLAGLLGVDGLAHQAQQTAVARYGQYGFEAAALTSTVSYKSVGLGRMLAREAELRFAHPYAVVAVASQTSGTGGTTQPGPWHGVPVFSAWVSDPDDLFER
ncbi:hypothetical protein Aph02nite_44490 [Actinoplanes philippinensis]|uniref:Serpin (Serine protease inhibitor) n=1 Tax=Actinoplanes philippinensis TaxID=35752 RepID=A0A1I2I8H8_9ACTN|nr:hypothetical protein [Actinoplanes philippinensis]GIE78499.1 hypothetical protein Aph02nite_44490 [Actinoplanes philippinensis]SFF38544.1 hypothetical protein SAMN05421541_109428 [Actinoplanes philippinensis]